MQTTKLCKNIFWLEVFSKQKKTLEIRNDSRMEQDKEHKQVQNQNIGLKKNFN
jgi:hypothetical protein